MHAKRLRGRLTNVKNGVTICKNCIHKANLKLELQKHDANENLVIAIAVAKNQYPLKEVHRRQKTQGRPNIAHTLFFEKNGKRLIDFAKIHSFAIIYFLDVSAPLETPDVLFPALLQH